MTSSQAGCLDRREALLCSVCPIPTGSGKTSGRHRLYKTEVIRHQGPWTGIEAVEFATLEWVDWFNNRRLMESIGNVLPAELETEYYNEMAGSAIVA
jgi:transposase InsO family protein